MLDRILRKYSGLYPIALLFLLSFSVTPITYANTSSKVPDDRYFAITVAGDTAGYDHIRFNRKNNRLIVQRKLRIDVTFLMFSAYTYTHEATEVWQEGQLKKLESKTNDNGEKYRVSAKITEHGLKVTTNDTNYVAPRNVIPSSYWNHQVVEAGRLLDTETGRMGQIDVTDEGKETLQVTGRSIKARKYDISGAVDLDLWYNKNQRWVKMKFFNSGYKVVYHLKNKPVEIQT